MLRLNTYYYKLDIYIILINIYMMEKLLNSQYINLKINLIDISIFRHLICITNFLQGDFGLN